jgi:hypothetical protein
MKQKLITMVEDGTLQVVAIVAMLALAFGFAGCQTAHVKTAEWEASINSHWFKRDVDKLNVTRQADGSYSLDLNGYRGDVSEQFPAFMKETLTGIATIGRIAATAVNPAASGVPLTTDAADASDVAALVRANAELKAQVAAAKRLSEQAKSAAASAATDAASAECPDGNCGDR